MKRIKSDMDVVKAAKLRIKNVFKNGLPVYMSFSGGKDSIVLGHLVLSLIQSGEVDASQLTVQFIDEEAIFPCIEQKVIEWRRRFLYAGAAFSWFCIEVKHFCCFNALTEEETFICWDRTKADVWVRQPPPFAVRSHPMLRARKDTYQAFLSRLCMDGITFVGVRAAESFQRLQYMTRYNVGHQGLTENKVFPLYDWKDSDIWLYIQREGIDLPLIYLYLWQSGTSKNQLRVSQFFSSDTAKNLVKMNEYYPDLMDRIIRREPNAYLAALYWDSEMFGRRTRTRRELEKGDEKRDYKKLLIEIFSDMEKSFPTPGQMLTGKKYRKLFIQTSTFATERDYRDMYEALQRGDPKARACRALYQSIYNRYNTSARPVNTEGGESA